MIALAFFLLTAFQDASAAQERIGRVEYTRLETRQATYDAMIRALRPSAVTWGEFHRLGPFPYAGHGKGDLATVLAPEEELERYAANGPGPDLARTYAGKKGVACAWENLGLQAHERIDLHRGDDDELNNLVQGYLYTTVTSSRDQRVEFSMGSDDGLRVWVNSRLVHDLDVPRGLNPEADRVAFDLAEGVNHVLFKVADGFGGWEFQVLTREELSEREQVQLFHLLDRDFPPTPERAHYAAYTVPLGRGVSLEVGGLDFLSDGRPILSTRRGDVWILEGGYAVPPIEASWKRFATGLHEPLGLSVRREDGVDAVYAVQRGELTRMLDLDGDDVADRYECASDGWGVSGNYHEFAFGPKFDADGNAWVTLNVGFCGSLGKSLVPWRGWALRIAPDGTVEPWADGLRSPNGIGLFEGEAFYVDNQGDYVATNRLSHLAKGSWHGHPASLRWREGLPEGERPPRQPASVWFPYKKMGQSVADIALCEQDGRFGPFDGQLFCGDQTLASVMRVTLEEVNGHWQGACYPFLSQLDCGVNRVAFAPDGSMFVGQTDRGWGSVGRRREGVQRIAYTGETPFEILEMRAVSGGFEVELTEPLDTASLAPGALSMTSYTYEYHPQYGAPEDDAAELDVSVERTGERTLRLTVEPLRAGYVHELHAEGLRNTDGEPLLHPEAYYTLIEVPDPESAHAAPEAEPATKPRVLFLTHSAGFTHGVVRRPDAETLAHAERALVELCGDDFEVVCTQDCGEVTAESLAGFDAVAFYTTGALPIAESAALFDWIRRGGAFVGMHCATDTWYEVEEYMEMIGGAFDGHPWTQNVGVVVEDRRHPAVRRLGARFEIDDEIYQFRDFLGDPPLRVLLSLDNASVDIARGRYERNPIAWCRDWGEGRVFYTALGHRPQVWDDARFREHVKGALRWVIDGPDYAGSAPAEAALVLDEAHLESWRHKDGGPFAWSLVDGAVEVATGHGDLISEATFADHLVHVEFQVPEEGNSGVYLHGRYEVQILDSHGRADGDLGQGDCAGLYGVAAPATNASRPPGRWQALDIRFRAPRFSGGGVKTENARATVWLNGIQVQDDVEFPGPTPSSMAADEVPRGPLLLQDHRNPVRFRNVWVVPLGE